ncbi:hypothetical protein EHP00_1635 [Ecytonucleospora hepatopenaei]|uniref:Uncharacterized protein n=1 Tax=Ecytonucleospora hepatopenaei TaxID=646526 RepID=A0A1W0E3I2_9MICR|nr:hypothetical protein EHP00_1635 [Ecytonucleospora hepatopenaei]
MCSKFSSFYFIMASDLLLFVNEEEKIVLHIELNADSASSLIFFIAYASIKQTEGFYEDFMVYKTYCMHGAQIIYVTNRKIGDKYLQDFLNKIQNMFYKILLHPNIYKNDCIESDEFENFIKQEYVDMITKIEL